MVPSCWNGLQLAYVTLAALLILIVKQSSSNPLDAISFPSHASWTDKQSARFDFIFNPVTPFKNDFKIESISPASLVSCVGYSACLLKDGQFVQAYKPHLLDEGIKPHRLVFNGIDHKVLSNSTVPSTPPACNQTIITIYHSCSTHWNPPIHIIGDGLCKHTLEWHSPYGCDKNNTNYEHPCYTYDTKGKLIDLTRWILTNGSSYSVDTGNFNATIKKFNLNVCNEAHETCGPNVSSCYLNDDGQVESGFNNLTSLKYDAKDKTAILTSVGQFNKLCPDQRVKTVVRFSCQDKIVPNTRPKLIGSTACESTIEWKTVHACPVSEIQKPATDCAIKNEALGIDIDLRRIFKNATSIEVPNITVDGMEKKMVLGLCRGINVTTLECEGRSTSTTSACLLNPTANLTSLNSTSSQIVGSILGSSIKLTDNRVHLESFAPNKTCQVPHGQNFSSIGRVGTRIEFYCSSSAMNKPSYIGYENCIHVFEWGTPVMCLETMAQGVINNATFNNTSAPVLIPVAANKTNSSSQSRLSDEQLKISLEPKPQTAQEMHQKTVEDTKKISESIPSEVSAKQNGVNSQVADKPKSDIIQVASHQTIDDKPTLTMQPETETRMNKWHKFFMIALIVVSLAGFIIVMFILDNKTRLGFPLSNLRRQARQAFQPQPVPYSRVDDFNNHLDL